MNTANITAFTEYDKHRYISRAQSKNQSHYPWLTNVQYADHKNSGVPWNELVNNVTGNTRNETKCGTNNGILTVCGSF